MTDEAISPLRRRMIEDMTIRKFAPKTQQDYIRDVKNFARSSAARRTRRASRTCAAFSCIWRRAASRVAHPQPHRDGAAVLLQGHAQAPRHHRAHDVRPRAAQAAGGAQPGGGGAAARCGAGAQVQGGAERGLWRRPARLRGGLAQGRRHRQQAHGDPRRAGQGPQGPLRDAVSASARTAARLVEGGTAAGLAVSRARSACSR